VTEPNVTAILRKTGGAKPNKTEGGKSFTAKALPPSFFGVRWQAQRDTALDLSSKKHSKRRRRYAVPPALQIKPNRGG
jgi:hypothetical protein